MAGISYLFMDLEWLVAKSKRNLEATRSISIDRLSGGLVLLVGGLKSENYKLYIYIYKRTMPNLFVMAFNSSRGIIGWQYQQK